MESSWRYPKFNDNEPAHTQRAILSMYGDSVLGELIWMAIPIVIALLALVIR